MANKYQICGVCGDTCDRGEVRGMPSLNIVCYCCKSCVEHDTFSLLTASLNRLKILKQKQSIYILAYQRFSLYV
jgi:hypothetical protein